MAGIRMLVDPSLPLVVITTTSSGTGPGNGAAGVPVAIPNDLSLNASFYAQWLAQDAGGPSGLAASKGSKVMICP